MMTYILMILLVLALGFSTIWNAKYETGKDEFMSISDSTFLRGFWCIIVVLVHVPQSHQNRIQDMIGSFAFVGVTFFFMTSAFGLKYSMEHKKGYMDDFWKRRLPPILIPALIANAVNVCVRFCTGTKITALSFFNIDNWVKVLLLYYIIFWFVYGFLARFFKKKMWQDAIMCLIVISFSLISKLTGFEITLGWIVEPLGFAYGIIAARFVNEIKALLQKQYVTKCVFLILASGALGVMYLKFKPVFFWGDYILKIALGIFITALIFVIISKFKVGNAINGFLAGISYEVYILHRTVYLFFDAVTKDRLESGVFILLSLIVSIILAHALKKLCKPIVKLLA